MKSIYLSNCFAYEFLPRPTYVVCKHVNYAILVIPYGDVVRLSRGSKAVDVNEAILSRRWFVFQWPITIGGLATDDVTQWNLGVGLQAALVLSLPNKTNGSEANHTPIVDTRLR